MSEFFRIIHCQDWMYFKCYLNSLYSKYNINEMLKDIIETRFYEPDYKNITLKLLYDKISYDDAIKNGIEIILSTDVFN